MRVTGLAKRILRLAEFMVDIVVEGAEAKKASLVLRAYRLNYGVIWIWTQAVWIPWSSWIGISHERCFLTDSG